jgi:hypothetical protein
MKKTIIISSLLLIASTSIISCKKNSSGPSFVGTWDATSEHTVTVDSAVTPYSVVTHDTTFTAGHTSTELKFVNSDSVVLINNLSTPPQVIPANYIYSGNKLVLFSTQSIEGEVFNFSFSGSNTFLLTETNDEPGSQSQVSTITFTKQ